MSGADSIILGNVSFGPAQTLWEEQPTLRELYDQACAGLVRAECEIEELRAEVALAEAERIELAKQLRSERAGNSPGRSDLSARTTSETVAFLRKFNLWRRGGYDQQPPRAHEVGEAIDAACDHIERMERGIEGLRDALCGYKCADKAAADGGWSNI